MINLTPKKLITYVKDYDYEINIEQSKQILEVLDNFLGTYTINDIVRATDYIVMGENSRYAECF